MKIARLVLLAAFIVVPAACDGVAVTDPGPASTDAVRPLYTTTTTTTDTTKTQPAKDGGGSFGSGT